MLISIEESYFLNCRIEFFRSNIFPQEISFTLISTPTILTFLFPNIRAQYYNLCISSYNKMDLYIDNYIRCDININIILR